MPESTKVYLQLGEYPEEGARLEDDTYEGLAAELVDDMLMITTWFYDGERYTDEASVYLDATDAVRLRNAINRYLDDDWDGNAKTQNSSTSKKSVKGNSSQPKKPSTVRGRARALEVVK